MLSHQNSKLSQNYNYFSNPSSKNVSPKGSSSNVLNYLNNINDSPKSNNLNTFGSSKLQITNASRGVNLRKFTSLNLITNNSKSQSINSVNSKNPVSSYISCSTLQSGEPVSYSIPRTRRFKDSYKNPYCDSIYNLPEYKSTGVSIGNSPRRELFDKSKGSIPSTHDYYFNSLFEDNLIKNRGVTISTKLNIKVNFKKIFKFFDYFNVKLKYFSKNLQNKEIIIHLSVMFQNRNEILIFI